MIKLESVFRNKYGETIIFRMYDNWNLTWHHSDAHPEGEFHELKTVEGTTLDEDEKIFVKSWLVLVQTIMTTELQVFKV